MTICTISYLVTINIHKHLPAVLPPFLIFKTKSSWIRNGIDTKTLILKIKRSLEGLGLCLNSSPQFESIYFT